MAVQFTQTVTDINQEIYEQIKLVETGSSTLPTSDLSVYDDGADIPTIGLGLNLSVDANVTAAVVGMTGLDKSTHSIDIDSLSSSLISVIDSYTNTIGGNKVLNSSVTATDLQLALNAEMVSFGNNNPTLNIPTEFKFSNETQAQSAFEEIIGTYTSHVNHRLGLSGTSSTKEYAALVALAYGSPELIGSGLVDAYERGDRASMFYEIAYNSNNGSNKDVQAGLAKRYFYLSSYIEVFSDINNPTQSEILNAELMYYTHFKAIESYEESYSSTKNADYNAGVVNSLKDLIDDYNTVTDYNTAKLKFEQLKAHAIANGVDVKKLDGISIYNTETGEKYLTYINGEMQLVSAGELDGIIAGANPITESDGSVSGYFVEHDDNGEKSSILEMILGRNGLLANFTRGVAENVLPPYIESRK